MVILIFAAIGSKFHFKILTHQTHLNTYSSPKYEKCYLVIIFSFFLNVELAADGLKGRVFEVSLADLQNDNDAERSYRKFKLIAEDVQGRNVLTNFHGMDLTTDKLRSMVKKWQVCIY